LKKSTKKWLSLFLALVMLLGILPSAAMAVPDNPEVQAEVVDDGATSDLRYDPLYALELQDGAEFEVVNEYPKFSANMEDLFMPVLSTFANEQIGMSGFEGEYALPNNPDEIVEIIVQFRTPPSEVLSILANAGYDYNLESLNEESLVPFSEMSFDDFESIALEAHVAFEMQLAGLQAGISAFEFGRSGNQYEVDRMSNIFNGQLLSVPSRMVPQIAGLPEVFVVTPNSRIYVQNNQEELITALAAELGIIDADQGAAFIADATVSAAQTDEVFVPVADIRLIQPEDPLPQRNTPVPAGSLTDFRLNTTGTTPETTSRAMVFDAPIMLTNNALVLQAGEPDPIVHVNYTASDILWSVNSLRTASEIPAQEQAIGVAISRGRLTAASPGRVFITATIEDGIAVGETRSDYTKDFEITFTEWDIERSNPWAQNFMRESIDLFELDSGPDPIWGTQDEQGQWSGVRGRGVRGIIIDDGFDYTHPMWAPYRIWHENTQSERVRGSGSPTAHSPQQARWLSGAGDGDTHGTHVAGSFFAMAPESELWVYRIGGGSTNWGHMGSYSRMFEDNLDENRNPIFTRNVVNASWGGGNASPFSPITYATAVLTLTGHYLHVICAHNQGPELFTLGNPGNSSLALTVGAGWAGGFISPYVYEGASVVPGGGRLITGSSIAPIDIHTWDWGWMPGFDRGLRVPFPENMEEIMNEVVFGRRIETDRSRWVAPAWPPAGLTHESTIEDTNLKRWNNGLRGFSAPNTPWNAETAFNSNTLFEYVWVGHMPGDNFQNVLNRLNELGVDISGRIIVMARDARGTGGINNARNFFAQNGAGALMVLDDLTSNTFLYTGGAGLFELTQGTIPTLSMRRDDARRLFPFPAGHRLHAMFDGVLNANHPQAGSSDNFFVQNFGEVGTINLGSLSTYGPYVENPTGGMFSDASNNRFAPNYMAGFSNIGPQKQTYHVALDIVGPGIQVHSTFPASSSNRRIRSNYPINPNTVHADWRLPLNAAGTAPAAIYHGPHWPAVWSQTDGRIEDWSIAYALQMGTSMASPTVAGIAALVWEAHPNDKPWEIKARLMNSAVDMGDGNSLHTTPTGDRSRDNVYNIWQVGAGFVNPRGAIFSTAVATVQGVPMPFQFLPGATDPSFREGERNPDYPIGVGPPAGAIAALLQNQPASALSFGPVLPDADGKMISQPLTVHIRRAADETWAFTRFENNVGINGTRKETHPNPISGDSINWPSPLFHPDIRLVEDIAARTSSETEQTFDLRMEFGNAPYGLYGGYAIFTSNQGRTIRIPFAGVPYTYETVEGVVIREGSGIIRPILAGSEAADSRYLPGAATALTNSNRSSVVLTLDSDRAHRAQNWHRVDLYARKIISEPGAPVEHGDVEYHFGSVNLIPGGTHPAGAATTIRHNISSRASHVIGADVSLDLPEGVFELFAGIHILPPLIVFDEEGRGQLVNNTVIRRAFSRFVVTNSVPEVEGLSYTLEGTSIIVEGTVVSTAHRLAEEHGVILGPNIAGNNNQRPSDVFGVQYANVSLNGVQTRPDADGSFSVAITPEYGTEFILPVEISGFVVDGFWVDFTAASGAGTSQIGALINEALLVEVLPHRFSATNPNVLRSLLDQRDVILATPGNLGIFAHHSPFIIPAGKTLTVETVLNVQGGAELVVEGTLIVLPGGRINNQGGAGGKITIAPGGRLINNGHVENVSNSTVINNGTIINNDRFEIRANTTFDNSGVVLGERPMNIHRNATLISPPVEEENYYYELAG